MISLKDQRGSLSFIVFQSTDKAHRHQWMHEPLTVLQTCKNITVSTRHATKISLGHREASVHIM